MAARDIFKVTRKTFFNPSGWIDLDGLVGQSKMLWDILKNLISPDRSEYQETFEEAVTRMQLSETDIQQMIQRYRLIAYGYVFCAVIAILYAFYLLFRYKVLSGWLISLGAAAVLLAQFYRYDFWAFQMQKRKLGLTFKDWKHYFFEG